VRAPRRGQVYGTEEEAFRRVEKLAEENGIWPGVTRLPGGMFLLLFDPPMKGRSPYAQTAGSEEGL
jgi:hypothetical protein